MLRFAVDTVSCCKTGSCVNTVCSRNWEVSSFEVPACAFCQKSCCVERSIKSHSCFSVNEILDCLRSAISKRFGSIDVTFIIQSLVHFKNFVPGSFISEACISISQLCIKIRILGVDFICCKLIQTKLKNILIFIAHNNWLDSGIFQFLAVFQEFIPCLRFTFDTSLFEEIFVVICSENSNSCCICYNISVISNRRKAVFSSLHIIKVI